MRASYYPTITGGRVRHVCITPGPKAQPAGLRKQNVTIRLYGMDVDRVEAVASAAGMTRQAWLEATILDGLRIAESA